MQGGVLLSAVGRSCSTVTLLHAAARLLALSCAHTYTDKHACSLDIVPRLSQAISSDELPSVSVKHGGRKVQVRGCFAFLIESPEHMSSTYHLCCMQECVAATSVVMKCCLLLLQQLQQSAFLCSLVGVLEFWGLNSSETNSYWLIVNWYVVVEKQLEGKLIQNPDKKEVNSGLSRFFLQPNICKDHILFGEYNYIYRSLYIMQINTSACT